MDAFAQIVAANFTAKETEMLERTVYSDPATWEGKQFKSLSCKLVYDAITTKIRAVKAEGES